MRYEVRNLEIFTTSKRLLKVQKHAQRHVRADAKKDKLLLLWFEKLLKLPKIIAFIGIQKKTTIR